MPLATEVWLIVFEEEIHNRLLKYYYTYDYAFIIKMYKNVVSLNNCVNCKQLCRLSQSSLHQRDTVEMTFTIAIFTQYSIALNERKSTT